MLILGGLNEAAGRLDGCSVAIGNFDGVHIGHQTLIAAAGVVAHAGPLVVLTFAPHPATLLNPSFAPPLIAPLGRRLVWLEQRGVEAVVVQPFDADFVALTAEVFVAELVRTLRPDAVTVGFDFSYGAGRAGTVETLNRQLRAVGVEARILAPVQIAGMRVSSSKVREFVMMGKMEGAALLLGRQYAVWGQVVHGAGRGGGLLGVPTLNLKTDHELLPRRGVYATWAVVPGAATPAMSVTNVGRNPTFGDEELHIETHVVEPIPEVYGCEVEVRFVSRLRDERRFPDAASLVAQIHEDIAAARRILAGQAPGTVGVG
ncbi:MAG: bifunctional riboflavin kinase/FAD synthetase [Deltaproteobacteria bacterium]|nr:bifunctional riboflavin kinase/FAD synthetase [Deltaproteobacteria bacterium]